MTRSKIISLLLSIVMLVGIFGVYVSAENEKSLRTVYLHAQGENPGEAVNSSTVYMGENADVYFAVDNPNKGEYDKTTNTHNEPQYDMNGYTLRICFDSAYFDFAEDSSAPIDYTVPDANFKTSDKENENVGDDVTTDVPQSVGYYIYRHGSGTYALGTKNYRAAYITVFYSGGYVPQKADGELWYNLAKLSLKPKKTGSTSVFIDIDSGDEAYALELFAKNQSDELSEQTFKFNAINGGYHNIIIKDKSKPAPPVATPASGSYIEKVSVELTHESNLPVYYTTDGSEPKGNSSAILYTAPIEITYDTTINACAYRESDNKYSSSVSYEYKILPDRPYLFDDSSQKNLLPDINSFSSKKKVYISDKTVYQRISDGSEVYYTFSDIDAANPVLGNNPYTSWVKIEKNIGTIENQFIMIERNTRIRLITNKLGIYSEPAVYYFSIKPLAPKASYDSGEYDKKIDITLSTKTENGTIFYTLDGSDPKTNGIEYNDIPITLAKDSTLRAVTYFDGEWSDKVSYHYIFVFYDDFGVDAFYPSGLYVGSVNVTLTPNNPDHKVQYYIKDDNWDGVWIDYSDVLKIDKDTEIVARTVRENFDGTIAEGENYTFIYKIKPLPPEFAPESTQFTNADKITVYTPESTEATTGRFKLYYTLDGSNPMTSSTAILADDVSDTAVIDITKYTVVTAVVLKDNESYSNVVTNSYDVVTLKPVKPLTTLVSGDYVVKIGGEEYSTQFMPVPDGTQIYYTICYDGGLCPEPVPNTDGTILYTKDAFIDIRGITVIKAVAVNEFGIKSDVGIFSYHIAHEAPQAAPSATISSNEMPVVPVDAVKGSTVKYEIGGFENEFENTDDERFYIDTKTGMAYRDEDCTEQLGDTSTVTNSESVTLEISTVLDGVESDKNRYTYTISDTAVPAPPYADKRTGTYEERKIDENNNIFAVRLYSLNSGGKIQYRINNEGAWLDYTDGSALLFKEDTVLQCRYEKNGMFSTVESYVYEFVPLPPVLSLQSGTYFANENKTTTIALDANAPADKNYSIWYRQNGDSKDFRYTGQERAITHTMSFKAYVLNEDTGRTSVNVINYYIIQSGEAASGRVYVAYPYDVERINASLLAGGEYAEGIKLLSQNNTADIHYYYTYTKKSDGKTVTTAPAVYDVNRPIIPTALMDNIAIVAWLEDENGRIQDSEGFFKIDFVHLEIPTTSFETVDKNEFPAGTKYSIINHYPDDENIILYYTLDGSDPSDVKNVNRKIYNGEQLSLDASTTVRAVYYSACGKCVDCKVPNITSCWNAVYGNAGTYRYTVPTVISSSGTSSGGGGSAVSNSRKYTEDIFGNEHPTHIGYINGYPDGSVKPEGAVSREEIAAILYRITSHQYEKPFVATGDAFPDVEPDRWSAHDVEYMTDKGVIYGYPDGEFKPTRNLTRAEFAALIFRFTAIEKVTVKNPFTDFDESHWAYNEILSLTASGLIEGYPDKTYKPENNITRAEAMTVINKLLGRNPLESYVKSLDFNPYNDLYEDKWYYVTVLEATITHNYWLDTRLYEYKWEDWK